MLIIIGVKATRISRYPSLILEIKSIAPKHAIVVLTDSEERTVEILNEYAKFGQVTSVLIFAGDGTCWTVINWIHQQPKKWRPLLIPGSGGNVCFYAILCGLSPKDPIGNFKLILAADLYRHTKIWRPTKVSIDINGEERIIYCGVFGNGVMHDFLKWMSVNNIQTPIPVVIFIICTILRVPISPSYQNGPLGHSSGLIRVNGREVWNNIFLGVMVSSIPELSYLATPFIGDRKPGEVWFIAYLGTYFWLGTLAPFLWFGYVPSWMQSTTLNHTAKEVVIETKDPNIMVDGSVIEIKNNNELYQIVITQGEEMKIFSA